MTLSRSLYVKLPGSFVSGANPKGRRLTQTSRLSFNLVSLLSGRNYGENKISLFLIKFFFFFFTMGLLVASFKIVT